MQVLAVWDDWSLFPMQSLALLRSNFLGQQVGPALGRTVGPALGHTRPLSLIIDSHPTSAM